MNSMKTQAILVELRNKKGLSQDALAEKVFVTRKLVCQCCGMPLDDGSISKEPDGAFNEDYCKWCYADGKFVYTSIEQLTDFLVEHMSNENFPPEQARAYFEQQLPTLAHWKQRA